MRRIDIIFCICLGILMCITSFLGYQEYKRIITTKILYSEYYYIDVSKFYTTPDISEYYDIIFELNGITDISQHILLSDRSQQTFPFKPEYIDVLLQK